MVFFNVLCFLIIIGHAFKFSCLYYFLSSWLQPSCTTDTAYLILTGSSWEAPEENSPFAETNLSVGFSTDRDVPLRVSSVLDEDEGRICSRHRSRKKIEISIRNARAQYGLLVPPSSSRRGATQNIQNGVLILNLLELKSIIEE
nr:hypothetical protein CFP56_40500 [Quercus suber]